VCKDEGKRARREWYKAHGICVACGRRGAVGSLTMCGECLYKSQEATHRWQSKHPGYWRDAQKKRRERLLAEGKCPRCGRENDNPGRVSCKACALKNRQYYHRTHVWKVKPAGVCRWCDQPVMEGSKLCAEHYAAAVQRMAYARSRRTRDAFSEMNRADRARMGRKT
jgi:NMD protein affecting ribosome stability and mRNA decay